MPATREIDLASSIQTHYRSEIGCGHACGYYRAAAAENAVKCSGPPSPAENAARTGGSAAPASSNSTTAATNNGAATSAGGTTEAAIEASAAAAMERRAQHRRLWPGWRPAARISTIRPERPKSKSRRERNRRPEYRRGRRAARAGGFRGCGPNDWDGGDGPVPSGGPQPEGGSGGPDTQGAFGNGGNVIPGQARFLRRIWRTGWAGRVCRRRAGGPWRWRGWWRTGSRPTGRGARCGRAVGRAAGDAPADQSHTLQRLRYVWRFRAERAALFARIRPIPRRFPDGPNRPA